MANQDSFANCVVNHHRLVSNPALFPDVFFTVDDKSHDLSGHSFVLKVRLPQLLDDGPGVKIKKQKKKEPLYVQIDKTQHITAEAMERVLVFAYSGSINLQTFTALKAIEVMRASLVLKIPRLLGLSSKYLQDNLTMENIFRLLKFSDGLDVTEAKTICFDFALQKPDFFTSANAEDLGFKLYQEVTTMLLKQQGQPRTGLMKIDLSEEDTMVRDFKAIYSSANATGDISFSVKGQEISAHKAILANQSAEFAALIQQYEANKDSKKGAISLEEKYFRLTPKSFDAMLRHIYYGDQNIDMLSSCELIPFAKDYKLTKLYAVIEGIIGSQEIANSTCLPVLEVAYNPLMNENGTLQVKLKNDGLDYAVNNIDKIDFKALEAMTPLIGSHILQRLQQTVGNKWNSMGISSGSWTASPSSTTRSMQTGVALGSGKSRSLSNNNLEAESASEQQDDAKAKKPKTKKAPKKEDPVPEDKEGETKEAEKEPKKKKRETATS